MLLIDTKVGDEIQVFADQYGNLLVNELGSCNLYNVTVLKKETGIITLGWKNDARTPNDFFPLPIEWANKGFLYVRQYIDCCRCLTKNETYCFHDCCKKSQK